MRFLHLRAKEHIESHRSSIFQHVRICGGNIIFSILSRAVGEANLRLKEALLIEKLKPSINNRFECEGMKDFLFL